MQLKLAVSGEPDAWPHAPGLSLSVSELLPLNPCTAMPLPTVQTAPPMSVLGPLHGPGSSVQCTLFAPLCVSDIWDAFADFKDCFVARLFN